jgi:iron complex transport system substrate-binding protein
MFLTGIITSPPDIRKPAATGISTGAIGSRPLLLQDMGEGRLYSRPFSFSGNARSSAGAAAAIKMKSLFSFLVSSLILLAGCSYRHARESETITVTDQLGRIVTVPRRMTRIAALHHFGGKIIFALKQQRRLVEQSIYGKEAQALTSVDREFAAMPKTQDSHTINYETLIALRPQCAFVYASFSKTDMEYLENAGVKVIAVRGEKLEESYDAVRLIAKVLDCPENGEDYVSYCRRLVSMVQDRLKDIPPNERLKVIFTGPKSIYTIATGEMLQTQMLEKAGAVNLGSSLKGFWSDVSAEQIAAWNPDVMFIGSLLTTSYGLDEVMKNSQFQSIKALNNKKVYAFPSNIGWWDYPAPQCVLGIVWTAKMLYPDRFRDVDIIKIADDFYSRYVGHTFTSMGGRL